MEIRFCGAAGTVTGSAYVLHARDRRILVDCGLFQGPARVERRNRELGFDPGSIDAVCLTHSHIDHVGRVPVLAARGYDGPIHATRTTSQLAPIMLTDSAHIQAEDARRSGEAPLYGQDDVDRTEALLEPVPGYGEAVEVVPGVRVTFHRAGHIFGSAHLVFAIDRPGGPFRIAFSGDVGRSRPIIADPDPPDPVDVLVIESTYGDRDHRPDPDTEEELYQAIRQAVLDGGNILVPAFALGRTQELIYHLNLLAEADVLPDVLEVYVDSPLSNRITEVVRNNPQIYDEEATRLLEGGDDPFAFSRLHYITSVAESKKLNDRRGGALIIASSGMCTGGRIIHHLKNHLPREGTDVIFCGYQAEGTPGRLLVDGAKEIRLFGRTIPNRARIHTINGLSGHAGRSELLAWARPACRPDTRVHVTHGEPEPARSLAALLEEELGVEANVPGYLDEVDVG